MGHLLKLKYVQSSVLSAYFSVNKCPIKTHNGANDETDYSVSPGPAKAAQLQALAAQIYDIFPQLY